MEFKIILRGTAKNWVDDKQQVLDYCKALRKDCPALYFEDSVIWIRENGKIKNILKLNKWVDQEIIKTKTDENALH